MKTVSALNLHEAIWNEAKIIAGNFVWFISRLVVDSFLIRHLLGPGIAVIFSEHCLLENAQSNISLGPAKHGSFLRL